MKSRFAAVVLLALASLATSASRAEIYGWVDPNGDVTYSNLPPPDSARVFDVMHEQAPAPARTPDRAAQSAQLDALNDRLRLMELEIARSRREVVDYPAPPPSPPGVGCGPGDSYDCLADPGPYYTTGILYGSPYWTARRHDEHRHKSPSRPGPMTLRTGTFPRTGAVAQHASGGVARAVR